MAFPEFFINDVENTVKLYISVNNVSNNVRYIVSAQLVLAAASAILSAGIFDL